jgi:hypothetical protein
MAPHSEEPPASDSVPLEQGISAIKGMPQKMKFPAPPKFDDPYEEREYLKGRLAAAFRIFGSAQTSRLFNKPKS